MLIEPKDVDGLTRVGGVVQKPSSGSVYGLSVVRNEIGRLPYLLQYYRALGIKQFLFVSDHSTDGSTEFLLRQPDCAVFLPKTSFKESRCGVDWQNLLLDIYCQGAWVVTFDADELFTYPYSETLSLPSLCRFLDEEGSNVVSSFLLDMYSDGPVKSAVYQYPTPFLETSALFDEDYRFIATNGIKDYIPSVKIIGGPRARLFYSFQNRYSVLSRLVMYGLVNVLARYGLVNHGRFHYVPTLAKAPLVKWIAGSRRLSNHNIYAGPGVKLSNVTSVILHFKFFSDFHERALQEVGRNQHFNGAQEYKRYLSFIENNPGFSFKYPGSRKFRDTRDLLKSKLMRSTDALDWYITKEKVDADTRT